LKGYYDKPIATLDFASLYPSIMMAHNLCYCTLLQPDQIASVDPEQVTKTPNGCYFVKKDSQQGLLPMILEELLAARKRAKKAMAEADHPLTKSVLNGRQLALKMSANSVYGFTGATVGVLPCLEISSSVTAFGRTMIDHTKEMVEERYTIEKGHAHDAQIIYGDTDSVFVKFGTDSVEEAMRLGSEAADMVSETFLRPIKLEFEKVYFPFLLMNKKRYAGLHWTKPEIHDKLDAKGIETVRRDNCGLVRQMVQTCLDTILLDKSIDGATDYVKRMIADLLQNKIDLSMLIITKSLGRGANREDYGSKQAHVELAERMRKRDPNTAPSTGDRVPYVMVIGAKGAKAYEKSEDPLYVLENNLPIDVEFYMRQLLQPLLRIFGPIMGDDDKAKSELFAGDHTRKLHAPAAQDYKALSKFMTKALRCLGCKALIKDGALCEYCLHHRTVEVMAARMRELRLKEAEYNRFWTQCQRCQGSMLEPVICSNRDCDIFYRRAKSRTDVQQEQKQMSRLTQALTW
jgi:DNA polymerase delta subunit 1